MTSAPLDAVTFDAVTFGEVMVVFVADEPEPLEKVVHSSRAMSGAETNVATGSRGSDTRPPG